MTWVDGAVKRVRDHDRSRPRSQQAEVGWSEVGGCRSAIGFRLDGAFASETDTWAAQRGTAFHDYLLPVLAEEGDRTEVETCYRGIPGRADLVGPTHLDDLKTTTLANSNLWAADHDLLRPKRVQAHGYAADLVDRGELPADCTIRIIVVPVDGKFPDWWAFEEPFNRALADEGADTLEWVREQMAAGFPLPKDKHRSFCEEWCGFFYLCRKPEEDSADALPEITDPELASAVARYGHLHSIAGPAEAEKKRLAPMIRGLRGITATGWKVTTSKPGDPGEEPDMDAVREFFAGHGAEVPMRETPGNSPRLTVTKLKEAAK